MGYPFCAVSNGFVAGRRDSVVRFHRGQSRFFALLNDSMALADYFDGVQGTKAML